MKHIKITMLANMIGQGSHVRKDTLATRTGVLEFEYIEITIFVDMAE